MLRPSYTELMEQLNEGNNVDSKVTSRYIIVIAAAKRARQLVDGATPLTYAPTDKSVSIAVNELYAGKLKINTETEDGSIASSYFDEFENETKRKLFATNESTGDIFIDEDEDTEEYGEEEGFEDNFEDDLDEKLKEYDDFEEIEDEYEDEFEDEFDKKKRKSMDYDLEEEIEENMDDNLDMEED